MMDTIDAKQMHEAIGQENNVFSQNELAAILQKNTSLKELADEYPYIKHYGKIFAIFMSKGITQFSELDQGYDALILQGIYPDNNLGYVIKIPKPHAKKKILQEFTKQQRVLEYYYKGLQDPTKLFLHDIVIPQVSTSKSQGESYIVMDKLGGKTIKQLLIEEYFSPLFDKEGELWSYYYMDEVETQHELYNDIIDNEMKKDIIKGKRGAYDVLNPTYRNKNPLELISYIDGRVAYDKECLQDLYNVIPDRKNASRLIDSLRLLLSDLQKENLSHNDLHGGNVLLVPDNKQQYKLGIIDFAS